MTIVYGAGIVFAAVVVGSALVAIGVGTVGATLTFVEWLVDRRQ